MADIVDIDLVAFPQSGMLVRPGTVELLEQALRLGAETVGGLDPCAIDRDPKGHVDTVFRLAEKFGRGVDIHLHEPGEMGAFSMELIIERTIALGMQGKVIVSHAFCLGMPDSTVVDPLIAALAEARIAIMTTASASRTVPPLKRLVQAGVVVCAGSDGIHDTWGPYGNADMLERAMFVGQRYNLRRDDELVLALDVVTTGGAQALGLEGLWAGPRVRRRSGASGGRDRRRGGCTAAGTAHGGEARPYRGPRWRDLALMRGRRTKLSARWVVGHRDGRHCLLRNGEVVFEGDRVVFVGHGFPGEVEERRDYGIALIAPGFVDLDALGDLDTTVLGFDNQPAWRKGRVWPRSYVERGPYEMCSPEELAFQKRYAFAQLLLNGITTALPIASLFYREWGETTAEFSAAATAAGELGLRVYLGPAYRSGGLVVEDDERIVPVFDEARGLRGLEEAIAFCHAYEGTQEGLVRTMLAPDRIETCTPELLRRTADAGRSLDVPVRLHCCQSRLEVDMVLQRYGMSPPEWLASLGFLSPRSLSAAWHLGVRLTRHAPDRPRP